MRYPASEKLEIIQLVAQSHLPVRQVLQQIGIPRSTFYRWCDLYQTGGPEALGDRSPRPDRFWNRIPDDVRSRIVTLALDEPELSPRELAVRFTDAERYFVSEASVYRLLKALDLITSPAFIVIKAADEFKDKTTAPNQLWQTDFTYLKVTGWGWFYLSTVLDDFSRYIVAWKLCTTMKAEDVTDTLELALQASGLDQVNVAHRPRLLSDNGPSYVSAELVAWLDKQDMPHIRGAPYHPMTPGKDRALASDAQEPHPAGELLSARRARGSDRSWHGSRDLRSAWQHCVAAPVRSSKQTGQVDGRSRRRQDPVRAKARSPLVPRTINSVRIMASMMGQTLLVLYRQPPGTTALQREFYTPETIAARSLDKPSAINVQNRLRSSRCETGGRPGECNTARPDRSECRLQLPIATSLHRDVATTV